MGNPVAETFVYVIAINIGITVVAPIIRTIGYSIPIIEKLWEIKGASLLKFQPDAMDIPSYYNVTFLGITIIIELAIILLFCYFIGYMETNRKTINYNQ